MKNSLADLNNYLFEVMERLNDPDLTGNALDEELDRAETMCKVGALIVTNAGMLLKAKIAADNFNPTTKLPDILEG